MELTNCPNCDALFVKNKFRDVCDACYKEEENKYELVYQYIRKRENRTATISQVVEATGVEEDLIIKFVKSGRIRTAQFPNLGVPCEKCGKIVREGRICDECRISLQSELRHYEKEEARKEDIEKRGKSAAYFTHRD
ncbi:TIGR03826 family flagellar region protein [Bacillus sp. V5-8f]|uniref:TIGR03826 family flagellar region protein n=1 Tax=Bacillus sp. V5-8f TaxID=2053044 RepID=UPI000C77EB75|nr:TIGR03826 family flagellar region protein [Bacillus sp. V5-8f]PLT35712.1 hypothetical protein CUU64_00060 [Bacillus sp. V5-8f]